MRLEVDDTIERERNDNGFLLVIDGQTGSGKGYLGEKAYQELSKSFPGKVVQRRGLLSISEKNIGLSGKGHSVLQQIREEGYTDKDSNPLKVFQENPERGIRLIELLTAATQAQAEVIAQDLQSGFLVIQDRSTLSANAVIEYLQVKLAGQPQFFSRLEACRQKLNQIEETIPSDISILLTTRSEVVSKRKPGYPQDLADQERATLESYVWCEGDWEVIDNSIDGRIPSDFKESINICRETYSEGQAEQTTFFYQPD